MVRVLSIDYGAFAECTNLESITILNPECEIGGRSTISNGYTNDTPYSWLNNYYFNGTIYGYTGSTAQAYAEEYGYTFESLGEVPQTGTELDGDANGDGIVNIADAVVLQKWLLGTGNLTNWKNVDLCKDNRIDVFDMVEMRKLLIQNK